MSLLDSCFRKTVAVVGLVVTAMAVRFNEVVDSEEDLISRYGCDKKYNFVDKAEYSQIALTDACSGGVCHANPKYNLDGNPTTAETMDLALEYCKVVCDETEGCTGFFFQKHDNGHEDCGFYKTVIDPREMVAHKRKYGAVCIPSLSLKPLATSLVEASPGPLADYAGNGTVYTIIRAGYRHMFSDVAVIRCTDNASIQCTGTGCWGGCLSDSANNSRENSRQACNTLCVSNSQCQAWSYMFKGECWLKSTAELSGSDHEDGEADFAKPIQNCTTSCGQRASTENGTNDANESQVGKSFCFRRNGELLPDDKTACDNYWAEVVGSTDRYPCVYVVENGAERCKSGGRLGRKKCCAAI